MTEYELVPEWFFTLLPFAVAFDVVVLIVLAGLTLWRMTR